jgi:cytochrome c-type biogenesis protein
MVNWIQSIAHNPDVPVVGALALGLLTAVSPCPLATNITATAYIAKDLKSKSAVLLGGVLYTLGRVFSYTAIGVSLYFGASKFHVARFFQSNGEMVLAPLLIIIGLIMLNIIRLNFLLNGGGLADRLTGAFKNKGLLGAFMLGVLFALAFCPYSGALFFWYAHSAYA